MRILTAKRDFIIGGTLVKNLVKIEAFHGDLFLEFDAEKYKSFFIEYRYCHLLFKECFPYRENMEESMYGLVRDLSNGNDYDLYSCPIWGYIKHCGGKIE